MNMDARLLQLSGGIQSLIQARMSGLYGANRINNDGERSEAYKWKVGHLRHPLRSGVDFLRIDASAYISRILLGALDHKDDNLLFGFEP
jgi:hypothetical protein